jgi:hypothetical protein
MKRSNEGRRAEQGMPSLSAIAVLRIAQVRVLGDVFMIFLWPRSHRMANSSHWVNAHLFVVFYLAQRTKF